MASSPISAIESILFTSIVNAKENYSAFNLDISNMFMWMYILYSMNSEEVRINIQRVLVSILYQIISNIYKILQDIKMII